MALPMIPTSIWLVELYDDSGTRTTTVVYFANDEDGFLRGIPDEYMKFNTKVGRVHVAIKDDAVHVWQGIALTDVKWYTPKLRQPLYALEPRV